MQLFVGTSGYSYKEWKGGFYPEELPDKEMLRHYAGKLNSVEINNTFYRMPRTHVVEKWASEVPAGFRFAMKASRRITHGARLAGTEDALQFLWRAASGFGDRLGCILFQLPPTLRLDLDRLESFLNLLPSGYPTVFQFGHLSWHVDEVHDALRSANAALCVTDREGSPEPEIVPTADWGYLRLRRPDYGDEDLDVWAKRIAEQPWSRAFVFFKHAATGPGNGIRLSERAVGS